MQGLRWRYTEWVWPTRVSSTFHHACRLWILQAKDGKQRESWKTTYLKTVHIVCINSDIRIAKVCTHSNQKSHQECSKQLTTDYFSPSTSSAWSNFNGKCPLFRAKKQIHCRISTDCDVWACIKSQRFTCTQKQLWQDLHNSFLNREVQIWAQISIYRCIFLVRSKVNCKRLWISLLTSFTNMQYVSTKLSLEHVKIGTLTVYRHLNQGWQQFENSVLSRI